MLEFLDKIESIKTMSIDGFSVIFLRGPISYSEDIIILREAVDKDLVEISEVSEGGSVNQLKFENRSNKFIVGFRGDILIGCKQNRFLFTTIIIPPESVNNIPVSCVEQGRWSWQTEKMKQERRIPYLINAVNISFEANVGDRQALRESGSIEIIQHEVWGAIMSRMQRLSVKSLTSNIVEIIEKKIKGAKIDVPEGANGVVILYDRKVIGGEIFFLKVDKSYIEQSVIAAYFDYEYYKKAKIKIESDISELDQLLKEITKCSIKKREGILSEDVVSLKSDKIVGFLTMLNNKPVHMEFVVPINIEKHDEYFKNIVQRMDNIMSAL